MESFLLNYHFFLAPAGEQPLSPLRPNHSAHPTDTVHRALADGIAATVDKDPTGSARSRAEHHSTCSSENIRGSRVLRCRSSAPFRILHGQGKYERARNEAPKVVARACAASMSTPGA